MSENTSDLFDGLLDESFNIDESFLIDADQEETNRLSREEYTKMMVEQKLLQIQMRILLDKTKGLVYPPIKSPEEFCLLISDEEVKQKCHQVARVLTRGNDDMAKDICQMAFIRGYNYIKKGEPLIVERKAIKRIQREDEQKIDSEQKTIKVEDPIAWLHAIIRNVGYTELKKKRAMDSLLAKAKIDLEFKTHRFEHPEKTVLDSIERQELHRYVNCLPERLSRIINSHFFDGISYQEIAERLGCPDSTIRVLAKRALSMLKDIYTEKRDIKKGKISRPKKVQARPSTKQNDKGAA